MSKRPILRRTIEGTLCHTLSVLEGEIYTVRVWNPRLLVSGQLEPISGDQDVCFSLCFRLSLSEDTAMGSATDGHGEDNNYKAYRS